MEVSALVKNHCQELFALRARLENERLQELLEVRQELSKQHKEELEALKLDLKGEQPARAPVGVLSSHILLAHLKKFLYNEYICALKELSKAWKDSWVLEEAGLNKLVEAMETNLPEPKVLQDSDNDQSDLMDKWEKMLARAKELQQRKLAAYEEAMLHIEAHLDAVHSRIVDRIKEIQQTASLAGLQTQVEQLAGERDKHRLAVKLLSSDHTTEVEKMKELVKELERKHAKEMEELRQYFEQKVAEVEKHYSEEIVSQHSRRLSSSSCGSDNELGADIYYGSGDIGPRISTITHICDSYTVEPSYKDLEDHYRADFEKRLMEYRDQLESAKQELEKKYEGELLAVRNEYESKMERLVKELSSNHLAEIQNIEAKHIKEVENMKAKWRDELASLGVQNGEHSLLKKIPPSRLVSEQNAKIEGKPEVFEEELVWTIDAKQKGLNSKARDCSDESKTPLDLELERGAGDMKAREELDVSHLAELNRLKAFYEQLLQEKVEKVTQHLQCQEQEHLAALKKELEEKHAEELKKLQSLFIERSVDELGAKSAETALHIVQLEQALRQQIRHELEQELEQKVGEVTALIKSNAEQEQAQFIEAQNKMMKEFLECNRRELELVKAQAEGKRQTLGTNDFYASEVPCIPVKVHKETQTFMTIPAEILLQDSDLGSVSNIHKENQSAEMEVAPQLVVDTSALPFAERSQIQQDNIPVTDENSVEKTIPVAELSPVHSAIRRTEECAFKPETFLLQLSKVQDTHTCDLHALQKTWLDVLGSLVQGADPAKEMRRLKESFITDCASKFQVLLEELRAIHESEIQEMEQIIQELQSNQDLKESLHMHEIAQLKATYASQLHADVEQAKHDIATALEEQIQALLAADETTPRPQELVALKDKLVSPYIQQLKDVQEEHSRLVAQLKKEHEEIVAKFNVTQTSETSVKHSKVKIDEDIAEIIKERDQLKKMTTTLRYIVEELMNYLVVCEDELNGTLLGDFGIEDNEPETNQSDVENERIPGGEETNREEPSQSVEVREESRMNVVHKTTKQVRRVHFAPSNNVHLINLIDEENLLNHLDQEGDLPANFRSELEKCVERLKSEASALLGLTVSDNIETKQKKLTAFLQEELKLAKRRLAELESERTIREVVSEGFGEHIQSGLSHRLENLAQLQDKARTVMSKRSASPEDSPYLQLLEEICHEGDRLTEEARREREDLQQQVDAADKQLRATRHFLEEQAAEREQERDEFLQEVNRLQEVIREREKELSEQQRIAKEVEALELQGKEALALQQETIAQKEHLESELKEAVDKIWILREIITDLEGQVESKSKREAALEQQLQEMRNLLTEQTNTHQQLADELESVRSEMGAADLLRHVAHLEDQLMRHRQQMEQLQPDSTAVNHMKSQLRELETALEKRTKDLESLHVTPSSASCSSPSEDVSIREQMEVFRCTTPDEMRSSPVPTSSTAILPMEELQRLQDKLQRHSRAEEAALKRIRDLEMQLKAARRSEEEVTAERDVLQERMEEQLLKISSLQARVDQQRRKVETELTEEIAELRNKLQSKDKNLDKLQGLLELRDREIKKLNSTIQRIKDALVAQEAEWSTKVAKEHEVVQQLQQQCHKLKDLYEKQKSTQSSHPLESVSIPVLFETLLAEKNAEIDELQQKLQVQEMNSAVSSSSKNYTVSQPDHVQSSTEEEDVLRHAESRSSELLPDSIGPIFQRTTASEKSSMVAANSNSDLEDLRKQLLKKESEIKYLKRLMLDRLNSFLQEMEPLKEKQELLPSLREDLHKLRDQLQETVSFLSDEDGKILRQEKELLTVQRHDLEKVCQDKEQLLLQANVEIKEKDELITNKQQEIDKLCKERDHLISQLRDHMEHQSEEKAYHQEKEALNAQQYDKQLENMVLLRKEIERLGKIVCEKDEIVQTLQQKLTDAIREKDTIVLSLKGELQDKMSEKDELVKSLKQELGNLSHEHESKVKSLNKEKEQLHEQLRDLEETEQAGAELYRQMSEHLTATLREKEQAQAMVDALRTEVETELAAAEEQRVVANILRKEVEALKTKLAESEEQLHESTKALKDEVKKLQEENSNLLADAGPIDDLTGKVQKELDLSARLDSTLLDHLSPLEDEDQPFKFPVPGSMNLTDILNKVMEFGMDALSFSELSYLHQETCTASSGVLKGNSAGGESEQIADSVSKNNEKELLQQITGLQNQLAFKEQEANERVNGLEVVVEQEKRHNTELQTALSAEQRRNGELHNRLGAQARLQADLEIEKDLLKQQLSYHEDRLKQLLTLLEQERLKVRKLEDDLQRERNNIKQLQSLLETERQCAKDMKLKDSELLESMRLKLEKVLDSEARLRFQVEQAKKEIPLTLSVPISQDNKEKGLSQEAFRLRLEVEQLRAEVALLRNHKESLEIQLTTAHNQLSSRQAEIDMMRRKVRSLQEAELRHQRRYAAEREEIIEKARAQKLYFEQQIQDLEHRLAAHNVQPPQLASELEQLQQVHASVLQELAASKAREKELSEQVTKLREEEASPRVNEPFLEKLKNMNAALDQHVKDNNEVALTLARLVEERQVLHTRIRELEDRLTTVQANESASKAACATLVQEKAALQLALAQCKAEAATSQRSLAEDDMDSRVRHLFGKYLRAESYRKALAWQKRYLLVALGGYQETEATTLSRLAQLAGEPEGAHCQQHHRHRRSARTRFKSAAIVVVAIHRMRYLVQRWYHGRNIGGSTVLNRAYSESLFSGRSSYRGPRRHAGSAASAASSGSWGLPSSLRGTTLLSPPGRDQPMLRRWQMEHSQQQWRSSETSPSPTYVQSNRLTEYVQRFDELQQRLGLAVVPPHQKT
ncbi:golgin subfamily A member 4 isoform X2 [Anabrus simplex]|uniref:golgin subfamily A member 4 isoform X2 n=1 Tax=Anabrus simplex TaxID=316456 RepID=UPI0035A2E314